MVPALAIGAGPLVRRFGPGPVAARGNLFFAAGCSGASSRRHDAATTSTDLLPSMLLTGIGVGLALPTLISTSATALPAERFGTGSAIVNTSRQVASALGVAILVTILGSPASPEAARAVFQHGWITAGAANLAAALVCLRLRRGQVLAEAAPVRVPGRGVGPDSDPGSSQRLRELHRADAGERLARSAPQPSS